jgi:hypothetical protein
MSSVMQCTKQDTRVEKLLRDWNVIVMTKQWTLSVSLQDSLWIDSLWWCHVEDDCVSGVSLFFRRDPSTIFFCRHICINILEHAFSIEHSNSHLMEKRVTENVRQDSKRLIVILSKHLCYCMSMRGTLLFTFPSVVSFDPRASPSSSSRILLCRCPLAFCLISFGRFSTVFFLSLIQLTFWRNIRFYDFAPFSSVHFRHRQSQLWRLFFSSWRENKDCRREFGFSFSGGSFQLRLSLQRKNFLLRSSEPLSRGSKEKRTCSFSLFSNKNLTALETPSPPFPCFSKNILWV